jgi:phage repressor protein C with HTH and peptisase S24 domain
MKLSRYFKKRNKRKPLLLRQIVGSSMMPKLENGRVLIASGWYGNLRPHDLVIINHEGREKVKRVQKINDERLYVVGDNQESSTDSRDFGWLPLDAVSAKVIWPRVDVETSYSD